MFKALIGDLFAHPGPDTGEQRSTVSASWAKAWRRNSKNVIRRCLRITPNGASTSRCTSASLIFTVIRSGILIVNFPTKDHWRSPSRLADIERGLEYFVQHHAEWGIKRRSIPAARLRQRGVELGGSRAVDVWQAAASQYRDQVTRPTERPKASWRKIFWAGRHRCNWMVGDASTRSSIRSGWC